MDTLDGFSNYLAMNEGSEATKKNYLRTVKRMLAEPDYSLTREWIMAYREKLAENFAPVTVNNCLAAINQYIQYCGKDWKIKSLRIQKRVYMEEQRELTLEEYRRLAAAIRKNQRLYMAIQTVCSTGIRISELRCLTVECLEKQTAEISCKGKIRRIYLSDQLTQKLLAYCRSRKITEGMIFITRSGAPWDRSNIWRGMKKAASLAGIPESKVYPHSLRHLFARVYYEKERDIVKLADILGHSNVETTRIYLMSAGENTGSRSMSWGWLCKMALISVRLNMKR